MAQLLRSFLACAILLLACSHASSLVANFNNETDRLALLSFKSMLSDDSRESLASWNDSVHFCNWPGVACGHRHRQRVASLALGTSGLSGTISPAITNLSFIRTLNLSDNQLHGPIPREIGRLFRLEHFSVSTNALEGGIPTTLSRCLQLSYLSMHDNKLTGEIPTGLSNCSQLRVISLGNNSLTGHIPAALTNLSLLDVLYLAQNQLSGSIPATVGNLHSLTTIALGYNHLSGTIPPSIGKLSTLKSLSLNGNGLITGDIPSSLWNLSSISGLFLAANNLSGSLPTNIGQLFPLIERMYLYENQLHGPIPTSLSNASLLQRIQFNSNMFSGTIPSNLGTLQHLEWVSLTYNMLEAKEASGWKFLDNLANCTNLRILNLDSNKLGGMLPYSIANLSTKLEVLTLPGNSISGSISPGIKNLVSLTELDLGPNLLTGPIPASIGMLQNLHSLDLDDNKLYGVIPSSLGNLTELTLLYLDFNELTGSIPSSLGNCQNLNSLYLEMNKLTGGIPKEILNISTLTQALALSFNSLTGPIPSEVGNLRNLGLLDLRMNKLSGEIPSSLGECQVMEQLSLRGNSFHGSIPSSLSALKGLNRLDLSDNNLSGKIPDFLQDFHFLRYLNLSFNDFEGAVPSRGIFANASVVSVRGNSQLCGGNPEMHLPACPPQFPNKKHIPHRLIMIISIVAASLVMLFCLLVACRCVRKSRRNSTDTTPTMERERISYAELLKATNGFSTDNLIGSGSFARVYKGMLRYGDSTNVVAVKVLNLRVQRASKSFTKECEALRNVRHRNIVKILGACSSIDFRGNEFKALVLEFMANGNLDDCLHPKEIELSEGKRLTLTQRLNIAIDVAMALDYLHNYGDAPIIHCDLKPCNVLLDEDMTARVGDFGVSRILQNVASKSSQYSTGSVGLRGTIGYVPPEYGMANEVSTRGDVYSYGILLLEIFTGKSPTDGTFMEGLSLRKLVELAFPQQVTDVIDAQLLSTEDGEGTNRTQSLHGARAPECIASVLRIGILCTNERPVDRPEMGEVVKDLHKIRNAFLVN